MLLSLAFLIIATPCLCQELSVTDHSVLSSATGRFVFGQISDYARHQFMLDTKTGELWHLVKDEENREWLQPILYKYGDRNFSSPLQAGTPVNPLPPAALKKDKME